MILVIGTSKKGPQFLETAISESIYTYLHPYLYIYIDRYTHIPLKEPFKGSLGLNVAPPQCAPQARPRHRKPTEISWPSSSAATRTGSPGPAVLVLDRDLRGSFKWDFFGVDIDVEVGVMVCGIKT